MATSTTASSSVRYNLVHGLADEGVVSYTMRYSTPSGNLFFRSSILA